MGKKVKKLISDCVSQRDSSFRLFEDNRIEMEEGIPKGSLGRQDDRNMELVNKVTEYIYDTVITGGLELIYLLRDKWVDEDDRLSEEDSNIVMGTFEEIDEFLEVCSKEFLNLKVLRGYMLATDREPTDLGIGISDLNTASSLSTIMTGIIKPMCSITRTRIHIIAMGKEKYGEARK